MSHTAYIILTKLRALCARWKIAPVSLGPDTPAVPIFCTADMGRNIAKALRIGNDFAHIPCFAHKLHRVMLSVVDEHEWIQRSLQKIINIARNFNKSDKQRGGYLRFCRQILGKIGRLPVGPCATRWNSYALSIERYFLIHEDLARYATSITDEANKTVLQTNLLLPSELANLKAVWPLLSMVKEATSLLEARDTASGV